MEKRRLGNSDLEITRLGYGAWAIGGNGWAFGWGVQDDAQSIAAIHRALDLGINWIDTAAVYGLGHSEEVVARALKGRANKPYIFTKCALVWDERGQTSEVLKRASIEREIEQSLLRLNVEVIDLYQIHWPDDESVDIEEAWQTLVDLKAAGKVRWIGVSNFSVAELARAQAIATVTSLQPPYSLVKRAIENDILPFCRVNDIGVIVYAPMQSGLLTGAMTRERIASLPQDDWRSRNAEFTEPRITHNLQIVDTLAEIGARHGKSPGEVAIAWTLQNPAVTGAIVGARDAKQVEGWIGAADIRLTSADLAALDARASGLETRM